MCVGFLLSSNNAVYFSFNYLDFRFSIMVIFTSTETRCSQRFRKEEDSSCVTIENLFIPSGSAQVRWALSWLLLQQTRWGQGAKQATRTPQFGQGLGTSNRALPEPSGLMSFLKFSLSVVVISHRWVVFVIRAQGHNSVPVLCLAPDVNKMPLFVSVWNLLSI